MGKRRGQSRSQLLSSLSKKQKKHLRDFGEEHPFHDRVPRKEVKPQTCELAESSDSLSSGSEEENEPQPISGYHQLLATLKSVPEDSEEDEGSEEVEDSMGEADVSDRDGGCEDSTEEVMAVGWATRQEAASGPADLTERMGNGAPVSPQQASPREFADTKHEALFSLETNFLEDENMGSSALEGSQDPFLQHVNRTLREKDVQASASGPPNSQSLQWPVLGQLVLSSRFQQPKALRPPRDVALQSLHLHKPLESTWPRTNGVAPGPFTPLQRELFWVMNSYQDLFFPDRTALGCGEEVRRVYCLHALNHVLKANARVLANNGLRRAQGAQARTDDDALRDQGLTRPKVLMVLPFRESALRVVQLLISLLEGDSGKKMVVSNKKRFQSEYGSDPGERPPTLKRPEDYEAVFSGNIDDHFRIGVAVLQRSLRLYAPFYSSDILLASPLGLRTILGAEGDKQRDFDFLSSIELLIIDQADVFLMQNWEHVLHLMEHMNRLPLEAHGVDFSRVRMWSLNGWTRYFRQTLLFGALQDPQISAVFSKFCLNVEGQVAVRNVPVTGAISQVLLQLPHVFQRMEATDLESMTDARFRFFVDKVLPQYRDAVMSHTLIYVPSYFDFVRLRNHFKREELSATHICEYTRRPAMSRARHFFLRGERQFLLLTERFHFYKRYTIKGVRNLIFYQLPTYGHFYSELCTMLGAVDTGGQAWTCTALYSRYDAQRLAAVVGAERAAQMLQSTKSVHLFITGER
ncbi:U3 small nucleolar RNA-associated protein 25 homolog isoform X1 [Sorex araneus]|uniref:U3 small nucleolar RNA-associated protein 25 homolog isoform X1 n=2 Tax=Sorex araneus TaxID=42254 RepID=UPI0024338B32|nr:U3 small nucleolar RNA-associated protein 25 homolog isoform X1 [Sorex araneus]